MADTIQIEITREQLLQTIERLPAPDLRWLIERVTIPAQAPPEPTAEERRLRAWREEYAYIRQRMDDEQPTELQPRSWKREDLYDR